MLDFRRITTLTEIFEYKGWFSHDECSHELKEALNQSIAMSAVLTEIQFDLFCKLLKKYLFISPNSYIKKIERALNKIPTPNSENHVFRIAPIIAPEDEGKNKSGISMIYRTVNTVWPKIENLKKCKPAGFTSLSKLRAEEAPHTPFTSIFVDDFIGSGDTLEKFYNDQLAYTKDNEEIIFVCIATMAAGIEKVKILGRKLYYSDLANMGIKDDPELHGTDAYLVMDSIEKLIKTDAKFRHGYNQSEGLITLERTPNNTFPIFWATSKFKKGSWPAPFPRNKQNVQIDII